jgi:uncharacterized protein YijF (DUF1287 family)
MKHRILLAWGGLAIWAAAVTAGVPDRRPIAETLVHAALAQTEKPGLYDPAYFVIGYPGGDVPADRGVCTDVVIRACRAAGIDLQVLVHEDMRVNFSKYPSLWGLRTTDRNIDHRRVPNLQTFFRRRGAALPVTKDPADYLPGDVVAWDLNGRGLTHIGMVVPPPGSTDLRTGSAWIVHNIGSGPMREERLCEWRILGHYRLGPGVVPD